MDLFLFYGKQVDDDDPYTYADLQAWQAEYTNVFKKLNIEDAIKYEVAAEGVGNVEDCRFLAVMMDFVRDSKVSAYTDFEVCEPGDHIFVMWFMFVVVLVFASFIFASIVD